jgi:hypothetical protein
VWNQLRAASAGRLTIGSGERSFSAAALVTEQVVASEEGLRSVELVNSVLM